MDSTHTFHLSCGELTLDSVSFTTIIRIVCAGDPIPFNRRLEVTSLTHVGYIERLFGMVSLMKETRTIKVDSVDLKVTPF